jgi:hypothetical protein
MKMKSKLIGTALVGLTVAAIAAYPAVRSAAIALPPLDKPPAADKIEVVFVLDTTSSMSGLIETAKEKIWSIATTMAQAEQAPEIRMGLVAFRDRGDAYVTQIQDLSPDLDTMYATLMQFVAAGGGDGPESVNAALDAAVNRISWSADQDSFKVVFLVGDAPPHMDYAGERQYREIASEAAARGIVVNTIQCGEVQQTEAPWIEIARLGNGRYMRVGQGGDGFAVATPYDQKIADLSAELDGTRVFFGSDDERAGFDLKLAATAAVHEAATVAAQARRAVFNSTAAGVASLFGDQDLVDAVTAGRVKLEEVPSAALPEPLRELEPAEREAELNAIAEKRADLGRQIDELAAARSDYIKERVEAAGGAAGSLDLQIYEAVRDQAAARGLHYESGPEF